MPFNVGEFKDKALFKTVMTDLTQFGKKGHEQIEITSKDGIFYPQTASKPRGFKWLLSCIYKPENRRTETVAQFFLDFLRANKGLVEGMQKNSSQDSLLLTRAFDKMDVLFTKTTKSRSWDRYREETPEIKNIYAKSMALLSGSQQIADVEIAKAKDRSSQLVDEGEKIKSDIIRQGKEEVAALRGQNISVTLIGDRAVAPGLRKSLPAEVDTVSFISRGEDGKPFLIKAHKIVLAAYASEAKADDVNGSTPEEPSLSLDEEEIPKKRANFFTGFFAEHAEKSATISVGEDYPRSTINSLLDFLYGVPKVYKAENIQDLLGVLDLTQELMLDDLHEQCKRACANLFNRYPSLLLEALVSQACIKNPDVQTFIISIFLSRATTCVDQASPTQKNAFYQAIEGFSERQGVSAHSLESELSEVKKSSVHPYFQMLKGVCNELGIGVPKDPKKAFDLFEEAADQGFAKAQFYLGNCYVYGIGVARDFEKAAAFYKKAADQGDALAQCSLGKCYRIGIGVAIDFVKAAAFFEKAADQGDALGQLNLGRCYEDGKGVPKDTNKAAALYKQAADQGDPTGQCDLGRCFQHGIGVVKDTAKAAAQYKQAADLGDPNGQGELGICFLYGIGVVKDTAKAVELLKQAAKQGEPKAQNALGDCFQDGKGVDAHYVNAAALYRQAADQGLAAAQNNLAFCYEVGRGVEKDVDIAFGYYVKAANQNHAGGQYNLAECFEKGIGVAIDMRQAIDWYTRASDNGSKKARGRLQELVR